MSDVMQMPGQSTPAPPMPNMPDMPKPARFVATFAEETTIDGRRIMPGAVNFDRQPPMPMMLLTETSAGHQGAEFAGNIDGVSRAGNTVIVTGAFDMGCEMGMEACRLVGEGMMTRWSPDIGNVTSEFICTQEDAEGFCMAGEDRMLSGTLIGGTIVPFPALDSAAISMAASGVIMLEPVGELVLDDSEAPTEPVVAAAAPLAPPSEWFANPHLTEPTPLTILDDGRVFGHIAVWGVCHIGREDVCLTAPPSPSDYAYFRTGEVRCSDGERIPVGTLTLGTGHADLRANSADSARHYDNTGTAAADLAVGEDEVGIWAAGALRSGLTDEQVRELQAAAPSGDWRTIAGYLELVAVLAVNVPGFPVPRTRVLIADGECRALVAAAHPQPKDPIAELNARIDQLESKVHSMMAVTDAVAGLAVEAYAID